MIDWTDFLIDKMKVSSIFGDERPCLNNVDLHEVLFHRDGPKVVLRFNLDSYPLKPPKKWVLNKYNTVQLQLSCIDVKDVSLSGWVETKYLSSISIFKSDGLINVCVKSEPFSLNIVSSFLDVSSVTAYLKNN
ncbi:Imm50 family immunity protein [Dickeya chrysanthemi]|uniref:Imm50 family immunity protein n=1 Tax=Dickeya chrysanthemi TaxID=556 RepID=UPI00301880BA